MKTVDTDKSFYFRNESTNAIYLFETTKRFYISIHNLIAESKKTFNLK